jgi:hypothetical protein
VLPVTSTLEARNERLNQISDVHLTVCEREEAEMLHVSLEVFDLNTFLKEKLVNAFSSDSYRISTSAQIDGRLSF